MFGPCKSGHWTFQDCIRSFAHLEPGSVYIVTKEFTDYDGTVHCTGEEWQFLGYNYSYYQDGLSLFVSFDNKNEWHIRLSNQKEEQGPLIDQIDTYLACIGRQ